MGALESLIRWISPEAALRRQRAMATLEHVRAYEGASRADGWRPRRPGASGRTDHAIDGRELRTRARALAQNVPYVQRGLDVLVSAAIGTGIEPKADGRHAQVLDALWSQWIGRADADAACDVYGLQALAYRAMKQDGEVLIRRRTRRPEDRLPVPLQVQVLEIDWLDSSKTGAGTHGGQIINGIEYDAIGRPAGYWLYQSHPGDILRAPASMSSSFVPARDIIHLYRATRPGQGRGITALASIIARTRDLMLYEDAELARKNLEARLGVLVSGNADALANTVDPITGTPVDLPIGSLGELPSGGITNIPAGMDTTLVEPKAVGGYVDYCVHNLRLIASGMGVPYESLTGDMTRVNYSSARIRQIEFRRDIEQEQWLTIIPVLCDALWRWFVDAAVLAGKVPSADYAVDWATPRWDYVNPAQDISAEVDAIGAGLLTPSESLRRRGYDPAKVFAEAGRDFAALRDSGALELLTFMRSGAAAGPGVPPSRPDPEDE